MNGACDLSMSCPVMLNQAQVSSQDKVWVPLFLSNLAAFCLGRLKSALHFCGRRVAPVSLFFSVVGAAPLCLMPHPLLR